jgi:hypothetical protein
MAARKQPLTLTIAWEISYHHGHGSTAQEQGGVRAVADVLMAAAQTGMRRLGRARI